MTRTKTKPKPKLDLVRGELLQAARKAKGKEWTQEKIAPMIGRSHGAIVRYEAGWPIPIEVLERLAELYDKPVSHFTAHRGSAAPDGDGAMPEVSQRLSRIEEQLAEQGEMLAQALRVRKL